MKLTQEWIDRATAQDDGLYSMKPVVRYTPCSDQRIKLGRPALIFGVIRHPAGLIGKTVLTSHVAAIRGNGEFETENTIYLPVG